MSNNLSFPLTFSLAPLPTGTALSANDFADQLVANLQATISGDFLTGQIGGNAPTTDIGPWANNGHWWFWDPVSSTYIQESLTSSLPTGTILAFGGIAAPTGFLLCDGALYLRSDKSGLFSVIGTHYGAGDGSSTFAVPNLLGRFMAGASANALGTQGGASAVTLSVDQMPLHNHVVHIVDATHTHAASHSHTHQVAGSGGAAFNYQVGSGYTGTSTLPSATTTNASTTTVSVAAAISNISAYSDNIGSGNPVTTLPPYVGVTVIIKN